MKLQTIAGGIVAAGFGWYVLSGQMHKDQAAELQKIQRQIEVDAAKEMKRIEQQVADDAVQQYGIVKRNGSPMDTCVQAGMVAAAYVQAKDEANYQRWRATEQVECVAAGVSR